MHVNEKTRACRCGTNYPSAAAVFFSEHLGEAVFRPLTPYTCTRGGRSPPLESPSSLQAASQLWLPADRQSRHMEQLEFFIHGVIVLW